MYYSNTSTIIIYNTCHILILSPPSMLSSGHVYSGLPFYIIIMLYSGDVIEMNMQMCSIQHNHTTMLCLYSTDVCKVYIKQNRCNAEYMYP